MWLLAIGIAALFAGPVLSGLARSNGRIVHGIDGFVLVAMGGLVLLHLLPHSLEHGGQWASVAAVIGLGFPLIVHRMLHGGDGHDHSDGRTSEEPEPLLLLIVAGLALVVHAAVDGTALAGPDMYSQFAGDVGLGHGGHDHAAHVGHDHGHHHHGTSSTTLPLLAGAVLLHRLPIGIALWWTLSPRYGRAAAYGTLIAMAGATTLGFFGGAWLAPGIAAISVFEAFVAGALLHVIFHTHVAQPQDEPRGSTGLLGDPQTRAAGIGAVLGILTLVVVDEAHPFATTLSGHVPPSEAFMTLLTQIAPALVAAFALAGLIRAALPDAAARADSTKTVGSAALNALRGTLWGLPLPVRPRSVVPIYQTLNQRGVPNGVALAMLAAGPIVGVDAALISLPLLGLELTVLRLLAAALAVWFAAWVAARWTAKEVHPVHPGHHVTPVSHADHGQESIDLPELALTTSGSAGFSQRLLAGVQFGMFELFEAVSPWVITGLILAGMAEAMLDVSVLPVMPSGVDVVALALLGVPLYFCATGGTAMVAVLLHRGLTPGAGVAFLLLSAGTSSTALSALRDHLGTQVARAFVAALAVGAIAVGLGINLALPDSDTLATLHNAHGHREEGHGILENGAVLVLSVGLVIALLRRGPRGLIDRVVAAHGLAHHHHKAADNKLKPSTKC